MSHAYNNGLHTSSKGITVDALRVTGLNVANGQLCTIAEDCKSGLVTSVTHTATGAYTFQLSIPYPPKVVVMDPKMSCSGPTAQVLVPRYQTNSYNSATGQFIINLSSLPTSTTAAAADGGATDELHVQIQFNRYKN